MRDMFSLKPLARMKIYLRPGALVSSLVLWAALGALGYWVLELPARQAVLGGLIAALLHWGSELWHHLGHAMVARQLGYPMEGVVLTWFLAFSRYPEDEPELPADVHIRRALGGPAGSLLLSLLAYRLALGEQSGGGLAYWVLAFLFLDNLLVFTLGALLPLPFTDGGSLAHWWPRRGEPE